MKIRKKQTLKVKEEIEKLGYKHIRHSYEKKSHGWRVVFLDKGGYRYSSLLSIVKKYKPRIVTRDNPFSDYNARRWMKGNRGDFIIAKGNRVLSASSKIYFYHKKCKNLFLASFTYIKNKGFGCPACAGRQVGKYNSLKYLEPEISKEWSSKNKIKPDDVTRKSGKKVWWKCYKCKEEWMSRISDRTRGQGCPKCRLSHGEKEIKKFLINSNIKFNEQHKFDDCKYKRKLPFDFYLPDQNICIEYHGEQHYREVRDNFFGKNYSLKERKLKDRIKKKYCETNNIRLIVIPYTKLQKIENILNKKLLKEVLQ